VGNIVKACSLRPDVLVKQQAFTHSVTFGGSPLGRRKEELIATMISGLLKCRYRGVEHGEFLRAEGGTSAEQAGLIGSDWRQAHLDEQERAMLAYCEKLTLEPWTMTRADVESLRVVGFDDVEILAIVQAAAYRHYITRVADALGVELTNDEYPEEILAAFPAQRPEEHTPQPIKSGRR
jgi:uncharacterized peroxidase-related enzyme